MESTELSGKFFRVVLEFLLKRVMMISNERRERYGLEDPMPLPSWTKSCGHTCVVFSALFSGRTVGIGNTKECPEFQLACVLFEANDNVGLGKSALLLGYRICVAWSRPEAKPRVAQLLKAGFFIISSVRAEVVEIGTTDKEFSVTGLFASNIFSMSSMSKSNEWFVLPISIDGHGDISKSSDSNDNPSTRQSPPSSVLGCLEFVMETLLSLPALLREW